MTFRAPNHVPERYVHCDVCNRCVWERDPKTFFFEEGLYEYIICGKCHERP